MPIVKHGDGEPVHQALLAVIKALEPLTSAAQGKVIAAARIMLGHISSGNRE